MYDMKALYQAASVEEAVALATSLVAPGPSRQ